MNSSTTSPQIAQDPPKTESQTFLSYADGVLHQIVLKDGLLSIRPLRGANDECRWRIAIKGQTATVTRVDQPPQALQASDCLVMLDGLFNAYPKIEQVELRHAETVPQAL